MKEVDVATKTKPPPPESEVIDCRLGVLLGGKKFADALKAVEDSGVGLDPAHLSDVFVDSFGD